LLAPFNHSHTNQTHNAAIAINTPATSGGTAVANAAAPAVEAVVAAVAVPAVVAGTVGVGVLEPEPEGAEPEAAGPAVLEAAAAGDGTAVRPQVLAALPMVVL
jgi:hypothetical protein